MKIEEYLDSLDHADKLREFFPINRFIAKNIINILLYFSITIVGLFISLNIMNTKNILELLFNSTPFNNVFLVVVPIALYFLYGTIEYTADFALGYPTDVTYPELWEKTLRDFTVSVPPFIYIFGSMYGIFNIINPLVLLGILLVFNILVYYGIKREAEYHYPEKTLKSENTDLLKYSVRNRLVLSFVLIIGFMFLEPDFSTMFYIASFITVLNSHTLRKSLYYDSRYYNMNVPNINLWLTVNRVPILLSILLFTLFNDINNIIFMLLLLVSVISLPLYLIDRLRKNNWTPYLITLKEGDYNTIIGQDLEKTKFKLKKFVILINKYNIDIASRNILDDEVDVEKIKNELLNNYKEDLNSEEMELLTEIEDTVKRARQLKKEY